MSTSKVFDKIIMQAASLSKSQNGSNKVSGEIYTTTHEFTVKDGSCGLFCCRSK